MPPKMKPLTIGTITPNEDLSSIVVQWVEPSENGGSPLTGYYVQRNSGYGTAYLEPGTLVAAGTVAHTFTNLVAGAIYQFRITAVNTIYTTNRFLPDDILNFSDDASSIVALVPGMVTDLRQKSFDYVKGTIKLLWSAPAINGSPIKAYTVLRDVGSGVFYPLWTGAETSFIDTKLVEG
jgi:hypothetical protein